MASYIHYIDTGNAAPVFARPWGGWIRRSTVSLRRNSSQWRKQVFLFATPTRPERRWRPRRTAPSAPPETTATSTPSKYRTGTPCPTCSPSMTAWLTALFFQNRFVQSLPSDPHCQGRCPQNGDCHPFRPFWVSLVAFSLKNTAQALQCLRENILRALGTVSPWSPDRGFAHLAAVPVPSAARPTRDHHTPIKLGV